MSALPQPLRSLLALAGHQVVVTDRHGITLWVNEAFTRNTGYALADCVGRTPGSVLQGPETDPESAALLGKAVRQGQACAGIEILNYTRAGRRLWVRLDIVPVHDEAGSLTHFLSVQRDVTADREAAEERSHQVALLQRARLLGFWQRDLGTGQGVWDDVCRALWGLGPDDEPLTLEQAQERLVGTSREALLHYQQDLAAGVADGESRYALPGADGMRHVRSLWQRQGTKVSGVLIDTTAEQVLSEKHERLLQTLALAAPAARLVFWRHDLANGRVEWMPGEHQDIFATDAQGLSDGQHILDSVVAEDRPAVLAARDRAMADREVVELEYRVRDRHGRIRHLLTRRLGVFAGAGPAQQIVGMLIDQSLQRERELAARRTAVQQALALKALRAGCYRFSLAERRFEFDGAMLRLYGLPATAAWMDFTQWLAMVHPDDRQRVREKAEALFEQPQATPAERFRICRPDGRWLWIETDRVPERDGSGRAVAVVGTHRDVSADVAAQAQARSLEDARLVAQTRTELLATLGHELRTPLNAVLGFAQLLQLGTAGQAVPPSVLGPARHIHSAGTLMTALLDDLRDMACVDAGALPWEPRQVAVLPMLDECRTWLTHLDDLAAARIRLDLPQPEVTLWADPNRSRQILLNLLSNALKYSRLEVVVCVQRSGHTVRVSVNDRGGGLDHEQLSRAFEPFERLGRELGDQPGTGLGLTVCRRLARLMGGDIEVTSTPGAGSCFTLVLPTAATAASP